MIFRRDRSGEIVNATLMEVFVVLTFMFLVYAMMVENVKDRELGELVSEIQLRKQELQDLEAKLAQISEALRRAEGERKDWEDKYTSAYPPRCKPYETDLYGKVVLMDGRTIHVTIPLAYRQGVDFQGAAELSWSDFEREFSGLRTVTRHERCRLQIYVTDSTSPENKNEYKQGLSIVKNVFYTNDPR